MKKTCSLTRKQFPLARFCKFCFVLVFCIIAGSNLVSAQDAYTFYTCCPFGGACNAFCPYPSSTVLVTPWGSAGGAQDSQPTFSRDGSQIAFNRDYDIYVMDAAVSPRRITNTANNSDPAWSPDNARIAFVSGRDGQSELYLMNPDGSNVVRLTHNVASGVGRPAWSTDSRRIAFNCQVESGNKDICAINPDGSGFVRLTADPESDSGTTWSPDGLSIAFSTTRYENGPVIAVMKPDGTGVAQLGTGVEGQS